MYDPNSPKNDAPSPEPSASPNPGATPNWRDLRDQERNARHADRDAWRSARHQWRREHGWNGAPIGALVLIVIGVLVLLGNFGFHLAGHWWAALILVPAVGLLVAAIRFYRAEGPSPRVIGPAIGGFVLLALALSLFFGFHGAGIFWPVILIAVGAALIARRNWWLRNQPPAPKA